MRGRYGTGVRVVAVGEEDKAKAEDETGPVRRVWTEDIEPLLRTDIEGVLSAPTVLEWLDGRHPGRFGRSHLRTLAASDAGLARASRT